MLSSSFSTRWNDGVLLLPRNAMPCPVRRAFAGLLAASALFLSGCAAPYLHDATVETQSSSVAESWKKVDSSSYFAKLRKEFQNLEAEEDVSFRASLRGTRDRNFASYISDSALPNSALPNPLRGINKMCADIDKRLSVLVGGTLIDRGIAARDPSATCPKIVNDHDLVVWSRIIEATTIVYRLGLRRALGRFDEDLGAFTDERTKWRDAQPETDDKDASKPKEPELPLTCDKIALGPSPISPTFAQDLKIDGLVGYPVEPYRTLVTTCVGVNGVLASQNALQPTGLLGSQLNLQAESTIDAVVKRAAAARADNAAATASAKILESQLKALQKIEDAKMCDDFRRADANQSHIPLRTAVPRQDDLMVAWHAMFAGRPLREGRLSRSNWGKG